MREMMNASFGVKDHDISSSIGFISRGVELPAITCAEESPGVEASPGRVSSRSPGALSSAALPATAGAAGAETTWRVEPLLSDAGGGRRGASYPADESPVRRR